jgi:predicted Zn-dependent protease
MRKRLVKFVGVQLLSALAVGALITPNPALAQISTEQEVALGRAASQKFEAQYGVSPDQALQQRLNRIGQMLVAHCGRNDIAYSFKVIKMDAFNALAFPGGFIYATTGLMQSLDDEQLAFVIGHEITHVAHRHAVKQMSQDQMRQMGILGALVVLSGGRPSNAQAQVAGLVDKVVGSQYSQADESDSDITGIQIMSAAGIDPVHTVSALRVLAKQAGNSTPGFLNTLVGSHPLPADRIRDAVNFIPKVSYQPPKSNAVVPANPRPQQRPPAVQASGLSDSLWTSVLQRDLQLSGLAISHDPRLSQQLANLMAKKTPIPAKRKLTITLPADTQLTTFEAQFLSNDLPALAQQRKKIGLGVFRRNDGSREVTYFW